MSQHERGIPEILRLIANDIESFGEGLQEQAKKVLSTPVGNIIRGKLSSFSRNGLTAREYSLKIVSGPGRPYLCHWMPLKNMLLSLPTPAKAGNATSPRPVKRGPHDDFKPETSMPKKIKVRGRGLPPGIVQIRPMRRPSKRTTLSKWLLDTAEEILDRTSGLDTAVRDGIAQGLTGIVYAANDTAAQNLKFDTTDQWMSFINTATADWFRERGFAEWFCVAAANGFRSSRPRERIPFFLVRGKRKSKVAHG